jgi:Flp pilus assembly protein TadB
MVTGGARTAGLPVAALVEVRAALASGAGPATALAAAGEGPLAAVGAGLGLGSSLADVAAGRGTGDLQADMLVRGLAIAERTGLGACEAVDLVLAAGREAAETERLLRSRTTQARGTAVVVAVLPMCVWLLLVALQREMLRFYATPLGLGTALGVVLLVAVAVAWSRRIVAGATRAADRADPLHGPAGRRDIGRGIALGAPPLLLFMVFGYPELGLLLGCGAALVGLRRRAEEAGAAEVDLGGGGTPEVAELVAIALRAGLPPVGAIAEVALLGPPAARAPLADIARRLRSGWTLPQAFEGSRLEGVGAVLDATSRWGAPAEPALRLLAAELRADRRAATEQAAERTQLSLIFPTTLLTLPAFVLSVVPPVLWTAFVGRGLVGP